MYIGIISQGPVNKPISLQELKSLDGRAVTKVHVQYMHLCMYTCSYIHMYNTVHVHVLKLRLTHSCHDTMYNHAHVLS